MCPRFKRAGRSGVDSRSITRFWNGHAPFGGCFDPEFNGVLNIRNRLIRRIAMGRAWLEIGNVRDPAIVLGRPEQIDMVMVLSQVAVFFTQQASALKSIKMRPI